MENKGEQREVKGNIGNEGNACERVQVKPSHSLVFIVLRVSLLFRGVPRGLRSLEPGTLSSPGAGREKTRNSNGFQGSPGKAPLPGQGPTGRAQGPQNGSWRLEKGVDEINGFMSPTPFLLAFPMLFHHFRLVRPSPVASLPACVFRRFTSW